jgi:hypothetical protein
MFSAWQRFFIAGAGQACLFVLICAYWPLQQKVIKAHISLQIWAQAYLRIAGQLRYSLLRNQEDPNSADKHKKSMAAENRGRRISP